MSGVSGQTSVSVRRYEAYEWSDEVGVGYVVRILVSRQGGSSR